MAKDYKVVFKATVDTTQLQAEANKALQNTKVTFNTKGLQGYGTAAKQSAGMLGEFNAQLKNLGSTIPKVAAFGVATAAIGLFTSGLKDAVQQVVEYDKSIEELEKVVGAFTETELREFSSEVVEVGERLSSTMTDVTDAVTTFVKTGASLEESLGLAEVAIQMQHTADETLDAATAAETLIAVMRAYPELAGDTEHIADAINNVSANFAISSGQIITNFSKVAATMSVGNTTMEETLGLTK